MVIVSHVFVVAKQNFFFLCTLLCVNKEKCYCFACSVQRILLDLFSCLVTMCTPCDCRGFCSSLNAASAGAAWLGCWGWWLSLKWSRSAPGYLNRLNGPVWDLQGPWAVGVTIGSCLLRAFQSVPHANPFSPRPEQVQRRIWMPLGSVTGEGPSHNPARKAEGRWWGFSKAHFEKGKVCLFQYTEGFLVLLTVRFLQRSPKWHIYSDVCSGLRLLRPAAPRFIFKPHHIASHISLSLGQLSVRAPAVNKSSKASQSDWNRRGEENRTEYVAENERKVRSLACGKPGAAWRRSSWHH